MIDFSGIAKKSVMKIGLYTAGKSIMEVKRKNGIKDVIKLASNENPLGPSALAVKAIRGKLKGINIYPESGAFDLRKSLAKHLKVREGNIIFGNGSNEILNFIAAAFVSPGDEVLFSQLSFGVYKIAAHIAGGTAVAIPHKNFVHDVDGFIKRLSRKTKLVYICNPNNPTGTIIDNKQFEKLMLAIGPKIIVALDEAYFEYVSDKNYPDGVKYLKKYPNLIVLRTFSKIYGLASCRIGYAVGNADIIGILERVRPPFNVNLLAQYAAKAALLDGVHVKKTIALNDKGKKYLYAEFDRIGVEYIPTNANYIFVMFKRSGRFIFNELLKKGVIIREQAGNYARITIGTMRENRRLIKTLEQII